MPEGKSKKNLRENLKGMAEAGVGVEVAYAVAY
jgi:hypothetical protein